MEIDTFDSCLIKNFEAVEFESITTTQFSPIHKEKISNLVKSQQPISFWLSWFNKCLTLSFGNDKIPILSSNSQQSDFHIDHFYVMPKWSSFGFFEGKSLFFSSNPIKSYLNVFLQFSLQNGMVLILQLMMLFLCLILK